MKKALPALVLLLALLSSCGGSAPETAVGSAVRDFRLATLEHGRFYMNEQKGKVVVLVFWATWCSACKTQMPVMDERMQSYAERNVVLLHVCADPENAAAVREIAAGLGLRSPVLLDEGGDLTRRYTDVLPTTAVIDQDGVLRLLRRGWSRGIGREIFNTIDGLLS